MGTHPFMLAITISNLLMLFSQLSTATTDSITQSQPLHDDGTTLVSNDGTFELGFFSPGSSTNRYIGVWYKIISVKTIVWVANRDNPVKDNNNTMLTITKEGNLVLLNNSNNQTLWSTNITFFTSQPLLSPMVQLLDNGNLVLKEGNNNNNNKEEEEESFLWQSFDHPCDTLLPGMKLGWDLKTGNNRKLTAWKSWDDPSSGNFTWGMLLSSNPELVLWKGSIEYHRSGPWNGPGFSGQPVLRLTPIVDIKFVNDSNEVYYSYTLRNKSVISITYLNQTLSHRERITWIPENKTWRVYESVPRDDCDPYNPCGPNGNCMVNETPICQCLEGFQPKIHQNWNTFDWTEGCVRSEPWSCGVENQDGFRRFASMKVPDTRNSWVYENMTLEDCKAKCLENCSCMAYSNLDIREGGSGCSIWFGNLIDLKLVQASQQDLYIRMAVPETTSKGNTKKKALVITIPLVSVAIMLFVVFLCIYKSRRKHKGMEDETENIIPTEKKDEDENQDFELPFFDFTTIFNATNGFSMDNKLGEGGFGPVYKGMLLDGREIAIKRLSKSSRQGMTEFKNEVILCAKLQHRNLVKVLGCCVQEEEKMLLYEYMPNKSLDSFIFDSTQSKLLDWSKRFHIICAIARGLLYLHQDSRLRIIHRDLKASNILLDNDMNPKISDFGLARLCGDDQIEGNTSKVVGTYGYMAPEYAIDGLFSVKSDVFSFGILLLEIVSGKKNRGLTYTKDTYNLIGHAWRLWKEGNPIELIDDCLGDSYVIPEALRCIQISLLCLQYHPNDRPNMASVIVMLTNETDLAQPKEPGFLIERLVPGEVESSITKQISSSVNEVSISLLDAR
ncbi:G-type lectin S-receptor-like serine/threonine-protein kinase At4g27290 isoform X2 [Cajanus cajan]|uniref:G-type lectin S-receptor-like serine/threonine-protein kinase At4g27290 isoform X2 n=1 Tax=Cajanus cajan TaxID=3821 RepID=UPI0010FB7438|nr:G-type lectin S-receptor-like serine/threonine-protein kinase At4g27290 isoform X2 [Cajanus cajan]